MNSDFGWFNKNIFFFGGYGDRWSFEKKYLVIKKMGICLLGERLEDEEDD